MSFSGFTGYQVISALKRAHPHLANKLTQLQVAGYTGRQMIGMLKKGKGQKTTDEDYFETEPTTTEHEKTMKFDERNKQKAVNQALGMLAATGTVAGLTLGAYQYLKSNINNPQMTVLPALGRGGRRTAPQQLPQRTVNVRNQQLPNQQQQLPYIPGAQGGQQQALPPVPPPQPQGAPQQPALPNRRATTMLPGPPEYMKTVDIVKNLRGQTPFENIIKQGFDVGTSAAVLRSIMKGKEGSPLSILEKAPGGLEKVISDYSQYMNDQKQQQQYSQALPKQQDDRVQFQQPPSKIHMRGPEQQQQQQAPQQQMQQQAPMQQAQAQQAPIGPGRQRLMGLMDQLRQARGEPGITPVQQAPAPQQAPQEAPLQQVASYPILPPAPKIAPRSTAPVSTKAVEKPKEKKESKAEKKVKEAQEKKQEVKERLENAKKREKRLIEKIKEDPKDKLARKMLAENKKVIDGAKDYIKHLDKEEEMEEVPIHLQSYSYEPPKPKNKTKFQIDADKKQKDLETKSKNIMEKREKENKTTKTLSFGNQNKNSAYHKDNKLYVERKLDKVEHQDISKKGLKEQGSYLIDHLKKAISKPTEADTLNVKIPGDGEFNFRNEKDVLEKALKKVEKDWPKEAVKPKDYAKHRPVTRDKGILEELRVR